MMDIDPGKHLISHIFVNLVFGQVTRPEGSAVLDH
jgi:hypothetical protein